MSRPRDLTKELKFEWSKRENDFITYFPSGPDGHLTNGIFCNGRPYQDWKTGNISLDPSFTEELKARGYDLTTLKFSVKKF